jgi:hypothetical protein
MNMSSTQQPDERMAMLAPDSVRVGVFAGMTPLVLLVLSVATTYIVSAIALNVTGSVGFMTRQALVIAVVSLGALISLVIYTIMCIRALRQVRQWQHLGATKAATGALWTLALVALLTVSPVLVALMWPSPQW